MKGIKKLLTGILAGAMAATLAFGTGSATPVMAAENQQTGSVTVNGCIPGEKYSVYKLLDFESASSTVEGSTGGVYTITTDSNWWSFINRKASKIDDVATNNEGGVLTLTKVTGTDNKYYVSWTAGAVESSETRELALADAAGIQAFAKDAMEYAAGADGKLGTEDDRVSAAADPQTAGAAPSENEKPSVEFSPLSLGYYLVGSSAGALVSLDTTNSDATVIEKNKVPTSEKKVKENNGSEQADDFGDKNDANIGETVDYKSTVSITAGSTNVVFTDEMTTSLDLNASSITLDTDASNYTLEVDPVDINGKSHGFKVTFKNDYTENLTTDTVVTITYSAVLNETAKVYPNETSNEWGGGNDNRSRITYGNAGETIWDWTRTYTYPVNIKKVDGDGANANPLAGAKFKLYKGSTVTENSVAINLTAVTIITDANDKTSANVYKVDPNGTVTEMVTPASGKLLINGLDADSYALLETEAPLGYNKLTAPETFTIDSNTDTAQGNDNSKQTAISVSNSKGDVVTIINTTGVLLPSTGGIGTTIFYIIGGILIVAGVAYFIVRRKANAE